jgi:hypothetical protein
MTLSKSIKTEFCIFYCYAKCHYAEYRYADCHYADCRYAECRGASLWFIRL